MQRATPLDSSFRGYVSGGTRSCIHEANDKTAIQELKINMLKGETREHVEHNQNYGFTSYLVKAEKEDEDIIKKSAETFPQFPGGNRSYPVVHNADDRRFRCRNFDEGEVAIYDDQQQKIHIMRKRIYGRSPFKIEFRVIEDEEKEPGHGRDEKASRDQKRDESKRLSTILMDKDLIVMAKTKPKDSGGGGGQQQGGGTEDDPQDDGLRGENAAKDYAKDPEVELLTETKMSDEEIVLTTYRDGDPHLQFKLSEIDNLITMQTIRNGRPNLAWTVDEENGEVTFQASPDLVFEMDDEEKRITLRTEKGERPFQVLEMDLKNETMTLKTNSKTEMVFNHKASEITIHADSMVKVGDRNASKPVGIEGTIDTCGDVLIAEFAQKVLVE